MTDVAPLQYRRQLTKRRDVMVKMAALESLPVPEDRDYLVGPFASVRSTYLRLANDLVNIFEMLPEPDVKALLAQLSACKTNMHETSSLFASDRRKDEDAAKQQQQQQQQIKRNLFTFNLL